MTHPADGTGVLRPAPVVLTRHFAAPRALVFRAWSSAEHMQRWFSPASYTVPAAEIDFRPGGICNICMRSPEGHEFWSRGVYNEIVPPERLVFTIGLVVGDAIKFTARTTVTFDTDGSGTRLTVHQAYEIFDAAFLASIAGAPEGWRTTLDKLEREVARIAAEHHPAGHGSFSSQRTYPAAPETVFHALTDPAAKARWFAGGQGYIVLDRTWMCAPAGASICKGNGRTARSRPSMRCISTSFPIGAWSTPTK